MPGSPLVSDCLLFGAPFLLISLLVSCLDSKRPIPPGIFVAPACKASPGRAHAMPHLGRAFTDVQEAKQVSRGQ